MAFATTPYNYWAYALMLYLQFPRCGQLMRACSPSCPCIEQMTLNEPVSGDFAGLSFHDAANGCWNFGLFWFTNDFANRYLHFPKTGKSAAISAEQTGEKERTWKSATKLSGGLMAIAN